MTEKPFEDRNFDPLVDRFAERIYASDKGRLRLLQVQQDLMSDSQIREGGLQVLDAGGGMGQMSCWLHDLGHNVTLVDLSAKMMDQQALTERPAITKHVSAIQDFLRSDSRQYDLVLCHAMLEWLVDPFPVFEQLASRVKSGGSLSLIFYNKNALIMANAIKGNWNHLVGDKPRPFKTKGLTPQYPIEPQEMVEAWTQCGLTMYKRRGLRVFHDYVEKQERERIDEALALEVERRWSERDPWWQMARYIHFFGYKTN